MRVERLRRLRDAAGTCGACVQFRLAPRPVPIQTGQLVMTSRDPVPRHCSHTAILVRSRASGGRRVSQSSREPLPRHAEQMTESLTTPDPAHAPPVSSLVSSITPILLPPWCATTGFLTAFCRAYQCAFSLPIYHAQGVRGANAHVDGHADADSSARKYDIPCLIPTLRSIPPKRPLC
jgi:hypothetical protein